MERYFFISYSSQDYDVASRLKADLEQRDFSLWIDKEQISPGTLWDKAIQEAIKDSLAILYLVSPDSHNSLVIRDELGLAEAYERPVWPIWIKGDEHWAKVVMMGGYSRLQRIDLRGARYASGLEDLAHELRRLSGQTKVLPFVDHFDVTAGRAGNVISPSPDQPDEENVMAMSAGNGVAQNKSRFSLSLQAIKGRLFPQTTTTTQPTETRNGQKRSKRPPSHETSRNPYKGLRAFEYKDARDFFGRRDLVKSMIEKIRDIIAEDDGQSSRCMLVVSASGAGKSSTVLAGLLPALQKDTEVSVEQKQIAEVRHWLFLDPVRPGNKPIAGLIRALNRPLLNRDAVGSSPLESQPPDALLKALGESPLGLHNLLQDITTDSDKRLVLTIDQFEELFAPTVDEEQQKQFIELLSAAATQPHSNVLIVATLRADFYDQVLKNQHLFAIMKAHQMDVPPMSIQDLREVIEKPAELEDVGVTFEPDLVGDLLYEVRKRPDALPLLQFTLAKLFEQRKEGCLTRRSYQEIGGLEGALNNHANATYDSLPDEQHRKSAKKLFTSLFINVAEIQGNASHIEFAEGVTSRRVTRAELLLDDPNSQSIRDKTLEVFTDARLLIVRSAVRQGQEQEDTTYEICHEVLISAWKRLQQWIEEDLQNIYFLQRLRPRIQQWQKGEIDRTKQRALLSTDHELEQLQKYQEANELSHSETEFLKQSQKWQRRLKQRTTGLFLATISLTLVVALVAGVVGYQQFGYRIWNFYFPPPTTVTSLSNSGSGSLRAALAQAPDGATITFSQQLDGKTIQLTEDLKLNKRVTIQGLSDGAITISSGRIGKGIVIGEQAEVTFDHVTFAHSYTHRASLIANHGILALNNCQLNDNQSYGLGGGAITNYNRLILNRTSLTGNQTSGNGGAIYDLFGIVTVNNSNITGNIAYNNGGGIYSQSGHIELVESQVSGNHAQLLNSTIRNNYGGGIDVVNGSLNMFSSQIFHNASAYYGGGIALQGSLATINDSTIHDNVAGTKGGGLIVTKDTDNNFSGLAVLSNIVVTEKPLAQYYIGQNTAGVDKHEDEVAGQQKSVGDTIQIADDDKVNTAGNPSPDRETPPEQTANYLGVAHTNEFCQNQEYSYGKITGTAALDEDGRDDIQVTCFTLNNERMHNFLGKAVCGKWFASTTDNATIVDRLTNYFDPSSLQCYKNLKRLGPLGDNEADFDKQCKKDPGNEGLYHNPQERHTAYDWSCQPKDHSLLPLGLSVANACDIKYGVSNAIDRLVNYNSPAGWECWQPA
jgi:hypothetical protein